MLATFVASFVDDCAAGDEMFAAIAFAHVLKGATGHSNIFYAALEHLNKQIEIK